jgi:hypothetical protein
MNNQKYAEVLVREGIQQGAVATAIPATYPMGTGVEGHIADLLPRIAAMRTELSAGNIETAVKMGHLIGGRSARLGEKQVASLVRKAVTMSRFYVTEQASDALAQAERELVSKN